jgi:hypothetical protein
MRPAVNEVRLNMTDTTTWPTPDTTIMGAERTPAPKFPIELLGSFWSDWCKEQAKSRSCPVDFVVAGLFASASTLIGNARRAAPHANWLEPTHGWFAVVGDPSSGKTQGLKAALDIVRGFDDEMLAVRAARRLAHQKRVEEANLAKKAWKSAAAQASKEGRPPVPMPDAAVVRPFEDVERFVINDATVEKVARVLAVSAKGTLLERDELAGWLKSFDRYNGGGDRPFWLEAFNGGRYTIDRMGEPDPIVVERLSVGIVGGFQPDRLAEVVNGSDDGLACRFLYFWPSTVPDFRINAATIDNNRAVAALARLRSLDLDRDERGRGMPTAIPLTPGGIQALEVFGREMREEAAGAIGPLAGVYGKAAGSVLRLATILTSLKWAVNPGAAEPREIGEEAIAGACALMKTYFLEQAQRVFGEAAIPLVERDARTLASAILERQCRSFNARLMGRALRGRLLQAANMRAATTMLEELGWIKRSSPHPGTRQVDFDVNPALHRHF